MEVGLSPGDFVLDGDPALPKKGAEHSSPIFGPFQLPQPRRLCVRMGTPLPLRRKGTEPPNFRPIFYCGQTAGWINMVLGMQIGLSPVDFALHGDPVPPPQKGDVALSPILAPCLL